jgi:hypothetical protein
MGLVPASDKIGQPELIRDVLMAEPMIRLIAATSKSIRSEQIRRQVHPRLHEAFVSIRQIRCIALEQLLRDLDRGSVWARSLNRLRLTIEQWTDMLIGIASAKQQVSAASVQSYGYCAERLQEFAFEASDTSGRLSGMLEDWFLLQGVRRTMRSFEPHTPVHLEWESQLRHLAAEFLHPKSFLVGSLTQSLQIDERFQAVENWLEVLGDSNT